MTDVSDTSFDEIRSAAHQWRARLSDPSVTESERRAFEMWMASDPRHRMAYEKAAQFWAALGDVGYDAVNDQPLLAERFQSTMRSVSTALSRMKAHPSFVPSSVAASAALILVFGWLVTNGPWLQPSDARPVVFATGTSEVKDFVLSDGSRVTLGASSQIRVRMDGNLRRIDLRSGDAFFDVAKAPDRPFVVMADGTEVRAIGTAFDVQTDPGGVRVSVLEGRVGVSKDLSLNGAVPPGANLANANDPSVDRILLRPGQKVHVSKREGFGDVKTIDTSTIGAWRRGQLVYVRAPLSVVIDDVNRYSETLYIVGGEAQDLKLSGTFDSSDIGGMIATIAEALPIEVVDQGPAGVYLERAR